MSGKREDAIALSPWIDVRSHRAALAAGAVAAVFSGAPSTSVALMTGGDPLEATLAAGSIVLPRTRRRSALLIAGAVVHAGLSLGWAAVLARTLPERRTVFAGCAAGAAIAALDLGVVGRRFPRVHRLPFLPQLADHIAYGATVALMLRQRRQTQ